MGVSLKLSVGSRQFKKIKVMVRETRKEREKSFNVFKPLRCLRVSWIKIFILAI